MSRPKLLVLTTVPLRTCHDICCLSPCAISEHSSYLLISTSLWCSVFPPIISIHSCGCHWTIFHSRFFCICFSSTFAATPLFSICYYHTVFQSAITAQYLHLLYCPVFPSAITTQYIHLLLPPSISICYHHPVFNLLSLLSISSCFIAQYFICYYHLVFPSAITT